MAVCRPNTVNKNAKLYNPDFLNFECWIFWKDLFVKVENDKKELIPSQKFIKFSEIKKKFEKFLNPNDNICVYCNTGSEGTIGIFVMKFLFGWKKAKLFEKSYGSYQYLHQICPDLYPIVKNN